MSTPLNPRYKFDSYVVGAGNRLAATAARAIAESPGAVYNPLFVYAGPGLGKTHLLMAIGQLAADINPQVRVEYLTVDDFVEAFHAAVAAGQGDAYRKRYTDVDLLMVDDVQFLTHRREMQAELLRLTNTMLSSGRQMVLSSDRPPNEIEALDERLIQRFAGGLVIDVSAPDFETRVAILRRQAEGRRARFDPSVIEMVASLPIASVRELIGALNRLIAYQAVSDTPLDAIKARQMLGPGPAVVGRGRVVEMAEVTAAEQAVGADSRSEVAAKLPGDELDGAPVEAPVEPGDEFGSFLSEIVSAVSQQVEPWRVRVNEAILRWDGEGYRTQRLHRLLEQSSPDQPGIFLAHFVEDTERLRLLQVEMQELDPQAAGTPLFRDPDRLEEALSEVDRARRGSSPPPGPLPIWTLESFVESPSNRMAVRAVGQVIDLPGQVYNPLVITGASGVGKTHLLHSIGNALAARTGSIVACLGTQDFVDDLIKAIDRDRVAWWRARYRRVSALLLDDIHLLAGKDRTQEELFWLFNLLHEGGKQMVFCSAVAVPDLQGLEPRLRSRMEGGLVVELPAPDREVRLAIAERILVERKRGADAELVSYVAGRPVDSARAVQELILRVITEADARGVRPSAALAREVLEGSPAAPVRRRSNHRTSGVMSPTAGLRSREKTVWDWPDISDRLIEDLR